MLAARFATRGSTNDTAARWACRDPGRWLRVTADTQTAGRGRSHRAWSSPFGGLWMSLAAPLRTPMSGRGPLPLIVGLAVRDELESLFRRRGDDDAAIEIKWPNDVLLDGRKVAGILCEQAIPAAPASADPPPAILGIGVNANLHAADLGSDLRTPAATLRDTLGESIDPHGLAATIGHAIAAEVERWDHHGLTARTGDRLNQTLAWRGRRVELRPTVRHCEDVTRFTLIGVDESGRLSGVDDDDHRVAFDAGEIHQLTVCDDDRHPQPALASA